MGSKPVSITILRPVWATPLRVLSCPDRDAKSPSHRLCRTMGHHSRTDAGGCRDNGTHEPRFRKEHGVERWRAESSPGFLRSFSQSIWLEMSYTTSATGLENTILLLFVCLRITVVLPSQSGFGSL